MSITKKTEEQFFKWGSIFSLIFGVIVFVYFLLRLAKSGYSIAGDIDDQVIETSSKIGDYIAGIVGTIWSLTGVLLFYRALHLQKEELKNQINELRETKEVFRQQQFENTLFNLIRTQQELTNQIEQRIKKENKTRILRGRTLINQLVTDYFEFYDLQKDEANQEKRVKKSYKTFFDKNHFLIGHYFRHLYHILYYIKREQDAEESEIRNTILESNDLSKKLNDVKNDYLNYASFIQAQMSTQELFLLFYNSIGFPAMKKLITKYNLLENLAIENLIDSSHTDFFPEIKFKSRADIEK